MVTCAWTPPRARVESFGRPDPPPTDRSAQPRPDDHRPAHFRGAPPFAVRRDEAPARPRALRPGASAKGRPPGLESPQRCPPPRGLRAVGGARRVGGRGSPAGPQAARRAWGGWSRACPMARTVQQSSVQHRPTPRRTGGRFSCATAPPTRGLGVLHITHDPGRCRGCLAMVDRSCAGAAMGGARGRGFPVAARGSLPDRRWLRASGRCDAPGRGTAAATGRSRISSRRWRACSNRADTHAPLLGDISFSDLGLLAGGRFARQEPTIHRHTFHPGFPLAAARRSCVISP
jgi:hypothetical protein